MEKQDHLSLIFQRLYPLFFFFHQVIALKRLLLKGHNLHKVSEQTTVTCPKLAK